MKTIAKPVEMIMWTDEEGNINPVRFKIIYENGKHSVVNVDRVISKEKERLAGNPMIIYKCQSIIKNEEKVFELKYELGTCKWILWKI